MKMRRVILFVTFVILVCCSIIVFMEPNKFQKFNSLTSSRLINHQRFVNINNLLSVQDTLRNIPYLEKRYYIYAISPKIRYEQTIVGGDGDCSNFSFGGGFHFIRNDIDFELVHFLPPQSLFSGGGHVAVRVPYQYNGLEGVGVVDIAGGGVPMIGETIADVPDLISQKGSITFHLINERAGDFYRTYYTEEYLNQVYLGFTPASEVIRYFNFIDAMYFSLGSAKAEKLLYDGLALLFGQYYHIYVDDGFLEPFKSQILLFKSLLLVIRICLVVLVGFLLAEIFRFVYKRAG